MTHNPFDIGGGGGGDGGDGGDGGGGGGGGDGILDSGSSLSVSAVISSLFAQFPSLGILGNLDKKAAGALASLGGALVMETNGEAVAELLGEDAKALDVLVAFGTNPLGFIWELIVVRLARFFAGAVLAIGRSLIDGILYVFVGDSLALETSGRLGLSDLVYAFVVDGGDALAQLVTLYFDLLIELGTIMDPSTGTALDGAIRTVVFVAGLVATLILLYRLISALVDAVPALSGVQTFLTGGS
jgi:hypothetical protein